jgi:hypothetical protein
MKNKKKDFSKLVVAMIIFLNASFTVAVLYTFLKVGTEPTSLIIAWFAFTTGELWLLSGITKTKIREGDENANN